MKISNETKVGAVTVISIALLIVGFNLLKGRNLFSRSTTLFVKYGSVDGLAAANPVKVNGLPIGNVTDMEIMGPGEGKILVKLTIKPGIQIPTNSTAAIVSADLLGSKAIVIDFGDATDYLGDDDTIRAAEGSSLTSTLMKDIKPLSGRIQRTLGSMDSVLSDVHASLDETTRRNLQAGIAELNVTMRNFSKVSARLDTLIRNMNDITGNLRSNGDTINRILHNTQVATASLARADVEGTVKSLRQSVDQLQEVLGKVNSNQGSLGLLLNDKKLYTNLQAATANLNLLMEDLRVNPQRYVHLSLFGRKNKALPLPSDTLK